MEAHVLTNNFTLRCMFEALWITKGWREEMPINGLLAFLSIVLWREDDEGRKRSTRELADMAGIDYTTFLRFSRELEGGRDKMDPKHSEAHRPKTYRYGGPTQGGLVKLKRDPFDGRQNIYELTPRGERMASQLIHALQEGARDADKAAISRVPGDGEPEERT